MRSTLHLKFILLYVVFGFLCLFTTSILTGQMVMNQLEKETSTDLYQEASLFASNYLPEYFYGDTTLTEVRTQLKAMQAYLDASVWFVDENGDIIMAVSYDNNAAPPEIQDFDPAEVGSQQYLVGNYHNYFSETVLTVIAPVTRGFYTKGYFLIHKPVRVLEETKSALMGPVYISLAVIYILSFSILIGIHFLVIRPLQNVTAGATQYASGNLDYEIPVQTQDEVGYLSASLNYMAAQLRDMKDYQKNFIANVSHDFRSPLTSIKGYVEAIADGTIPPEMQDKYLGIISYETDRLTELTKDLLLLNEYDTKDLLLNQTDFDIQDVIKTTAGSFEGICTKNHISIEMLLLPKPALVHADSRRIQQVLYNLLDNAIKFSEPESSVVIEVSEKNEKYYISVRDSGCGIAKKDLGKIWERFYKTDLSRGKDKKGTGLGLSIVKEAIQAHDEHINVVSTEGVGTEFIFSLSKA
mgnify:FL=1